MLINFGTENHEKCTAVCILMDRLMIPLYQANPHNHSVRKNVRGLAVMGMFLGLLYKFGLDLLSPGNLVEPISSISTKGRFGRASGLYFLRPVKTFEVIIGLSLALARGIRLRVALQGEP